MSIKAFGLIYSGEDNPFLRDLTSSRCVAAVPFGGRYRCIDFILSNLVNSGITSVGLITQKNYHSIMDHLGSGKEWDLHRKREGLFILPPFLTKESPGLYRGSVDAIRSCLGYVNRCSEPYCILSGSHTVFNMTFQNALKYHVDNGADVTIIYNDVDLSIQREQNKDIRLDLDEDGRIVGMELDPYPPHSIHRSMDVMIIGKQLLEYLIEDAYSRGEYSFNRDVLLKNYKSLRMFGYPYSGYVARLDSINDYFRHNMDLLSSDIRADLFNRDHAIYTKVKDEVSTKYSDKADVHDSLLADGCNISGSVSHSILFRGVSIGNNSSVRNSIIMQGVKIGDNCTLDHVIMDKGCIVQNGRSLTGYDSYPILIRKSTVV